LRQGTKSFVAVFGSLEYSAGDEATRIVALASVRKSSTSPFERNFHIRHGPNFETVRYHRQSPFFRKAEFWRLIEILSGMRSSFARFPQ
jgi:hypothetical protein